MTRPPDIGEAIARLDPRTEWVVLCEGTSDKLALEAAAMASGVALGAGEGAVLAMGGITNLQAYLSEFTDRRPDITLSGLCDAGETPVVTRALRRSGFAIGPGRRGLNRAGFFVCEEDLEDELIGAAGDDLLEQIIDEQGEGRALQSFRAQPAQRDRTRRAQLRRFMGTKSGRKAKYATLIVDALPPHAIPQPLIEALRHHSRIDEQPGSV